MNPITSPEILENPAPDRVSNHWSWASALIAVVIFSLTVPMTKVALVEFTPELVAWSRAALAGIASLILILSLDWAWPTKKQFILLLVGGSCVILIFPYTISLSLEEWSAANMGVVLAAVPLLTAMIAAIVLNEKQHVFFWVSIFVGTCLLMHFAHSQSAAGMHPSVYIMLISACVGYSIGGHVAKTLGGFQTICWMAVIYLPISLLGLGYEIPKNIVTLNETSLDAYLAVIYLAILSQWFGFKFWYGSMAKIGVANAGQVQLLQPFFTLLFSVPLLGTLLKPDHFIYAGLITVSILVAIKFRR